jgi:hypothetical protein
LFVRTYFNRRLKIDSRIGSGKRLRKGDKKKKYGKESEEQINKASISDAHNYFCHQKSLLFTGSRLRFSPFIHTGADNFISSLPQRISLSLHMIQPKKEPCLLKASIQYWEHDGYIEQRSPSALEM